MPRIGVLGGTFDPPHFGHLALAEEALNKCGLDKILFIPARYPPHKSAENVSSEIDRMNMLKLALEGRPEFEISDLELNRNGLSYTVDTLREIRESFLDSEIFFIIGADNISEMEYWHRPEGILELAAVVAFTRTGFESKGKFSSRIEQYEMTPVDISSTCVRTRVRNKRSIAGLVPEAVERYISEKGLYGR